MSRDNVVGGCAAVESPEGVNTNFRHAGTEGPNNVVWDGALSNGAKATPGVYFYRIDGVQFDGSHTAQKMILLSSN